MKRQFKEITKQAYAQLAGQDHSLLSIAFVDRDIEEVTVLVNRMFERIQAARAESRKNEEALRASIALISHDMRTPLTAVIGYLQLAKKGCKDEKVLGNIQIAEERAIYCNRLINDFFELSVIDSNAYDIHWEKLDIGEILCEQILANYPNFEKKKIIPRFEQHGQQFYIEGDALLLERALQNLISNSIKYSSGQIVFSLLKRSLANMVVLQVANSVDRVVDTAHVFDRFYREDAVRGTDGTGLGLYICRKFIEDMGGSITAQCEEGIFTIEAAFSFSPAGPP